MKHKKLLLVALSLALFVVREAQVDAETLVNQSNWASGDPISIIVKNVTPGNTHRRVIAFERAASDPNLHAAILVVAHTP
jgi:hypothetical protein